MLDTPIKQELSLVEMLEGPGRLVIHEMSDRIGPNGQPFVKVSKWRRVPDAWEEVQARWPELGRTLFARINDVTADDRKRIPSTAIPRLRIKGGDPDQNILEGPDGLSLYDPIFCVQEADPATVYAKKAISSEFGYIITRLLEDVGLSEAKQKDLYDGFRKIAKSDPERAADFRKAQGEEEVHQEFLEKQLEYIRRILRDAHAKEHIVLAKDRGGRPPNFLMPAFALFLEEEIWPQLPCPPSRTEFVDKMNKLNARIRLESRKVGDNEVVARLSPLDPDEHDGGQRTVKNWLKADSVRLDFIWNTAR